MSYPLIYVEWEDANRNGEWVDTDAVDAEPSRCRSVGFLIKEGPRAITLALTDGGNQVCCQMTIPRGMITQITPLALPLGQIGLRDDE